ncbi:MAG TPA: hypothetical protein VEV43_05115, partial [Actinomycetota bacterium]|nr:hypothetical protein [Actinomycetota bacterium]
MIRGNRIFAGALLALLVVGALSGAAALAEERVDEAVQETEAPLDVVATLPSEDVGDQPRTSPAEEPAAEEPGDQVFEETWWKRRLLGKSERRPEPEPEPEPEPLPEEPEPEPEPAAEVAEVAEVAYEEPETVAAYEDPEVAEVTYDEPAAYVEDEELVYADDEALVYADDDDELLEDEPLPDLTDVGDDAPASSLSANVPGPRRARLEGERRVKRRRELTRGAIAAAVA